MQLTLLCPFPVDVVPWIAPEPRLTVIVKATYALDHDGELHLAGEQRPLDADAPEGSADELLTASDRAPHKERVDVLLTGHAHAHAPAITHEIGLDVGVLRRRFHAVSATPAAAFPLTPAYLRTDPGPAGVAVRVGPIGPRSPARRAFLGDHEQDRAGAPLGALAGDFDFGFFNAAPLPQQIEALPPATEITLTGLLANAPRRTVTLPRRRPLVYLVEAAERAGIPLGMRCDTAHVDVDRAQLSLVWRGSFDAAAAAARPLILVGYEVAGTRYSNDELRERLHGARREAPRSLPTEPPRARPARSKTVLIEVPARPAPSARPYDGRNTIASEAGPPNPATLPFARSNPAAVLLGLPTKPAYDGRSTIAAEDATRVGDDRTRTPALPFGSAATHLPFAESAPRRPYDGRSTVVGDAERSRDALPFRPAAAAPAPPAPPAPRPRLSRDDDEVTQIGIEPKAAPLPFTAPAPEPLPFTAPEPLPFTAPEPPPLVARPDLPAPPPFIPAPPPEAAPEEEEPPTIPPPPPEPEPERITSDDEEEDALRAEGKPPPPPQPLLDVAAFAAVRAELLHAGAAGGPGPQAGKRREILARHGFDPASWKRQERSQIEAIEEEARAGKADRAAALEEALRGAGAL